MSSHRIGARFAAEGTAIVVAAVIAGPVLHLVWWQVTLIVFAVLGIAIYLESTPSTDQAASPPPPRQPPRVIEEAPHVRVLQEPVRIPEPAPESVAVAVAAAPARISGPPFNVWELERAIEAAGEADDEKTFLLHYLRDYAGSNGQLPPEFDDLVRESFRSVL